MATASAQVISLRRPGWNPAVLDDEIELTDTYATCTLLQRELAALRTGALKVVIARSGLCKNTVARLLYGTTHMPRHNTVIVLLQALGFTVIARRR